MGKAVKKLGKTVSKVVSKVPFGANAITDTFKGTEKLLGLANKKGGSPGPKLNEDLFDQRAEVDERTAMARQASQGLITDLQKQARGEGPSLAAEQLKSASSRNLAQTLAAASAQRGGNPALAQRNILQQKGTADRAVAEQSAIARMQEQQAAQNQLTGLALGQQGQDLSQVIQPADLRARGETTRFAGDVARRNAVRQQQQALLNSFTDAGATLGAAAISDENQKIALDDKAPEKPKAKNKYAEALLKSVGSTAKSKPAMAKSAGIDSEFENMVQRFEPDSMAVSDENQKQTSPINPKKDVKDFLDKLQARSYVYKNPEMQGAAPGKRYGIMAQDLEKSEVGKSLVKDTEQGKVVDTVQGFGAVLAAQAELNNRLKKLEKGKK